MNYFALIMAGGIGSRLWPRSRLLHPKQFLDIAGDLTMLQQARHRIETIIPPSRTLIATNHSYIDLVSGQLPQLPLDNILGEPQGRGTAAAIGLAAVHIRHRDPDGIMAVLTADHLIKKVEEFCKALTAAAEIASQGWLVTLGITPGYPETGYGYIERGKKQQTCEGFDVFEVARFVEKPDLERAKEYLRTGQYAWNSGMFIWKVNRVLKEMEAHMPELYQQLIKIEKSIGTPDYNQVLWEVFPSLPNLSIDYGIMEKANQVAVIPVDIGWNDVGSWSAVYDVLPRDEMENVVVGNHLGIETRNSLVYSPKRLVATIGLKDIVVVDTDDVILICERSRSQDVKKLVDQLKTNGAEGYLIGQQISYQLKKDELRRIWSGLGEEDRALLTLILHVGLTPEEIARLSGNDLDLINGWVTLAIGKRPLADLSREVIFEWLRTLDKIKVMFSDYWRGIAEIEAALLKMGEPYGLMLSVEGLHDALARALFASSDENQVMQNVLGEAANYVRVPLHNQFPFNTVEYTTSDQKTRAKNVLNGAVSYLMQEG